MLEFRYDTRLPIGGHGLDEDGNNGISRQARGEHG